MDRLLASVAGIGVMMAATRDAGNGGQHVPVEDLVVMVIGRRECGESDPGDLPAGLSGPQPFSG
jgi:hypothetical protein